MKLKYIKIIIIIFLFGTFYNNTIAQSNYFVEESKTFYGGLLAGFNFATIDNDDFTQYNKVGMNTGAVVYILFTNHLAASMEMLYSEKGRVSHDLVATGIQGVNFTEIHTTLKYAEIPIMINYFDRKQGILGIGLSYCRLINSSDYMTTDPYVYIDPAKYPFNKEDLELLVGGQLHLKNNFYLTIRFQISVAEIRNKVPTDFYPTEQYNNLWVLRLMYLFK